MNYKRILFTAVLVMPGVYATFPPTALSQFTEQDIEFFESKVRPILVEHCSECHGSGSEQPEGGFSIGSRESIVGGGDTGPAIVPGDSAKSLLVDAINYRGYYEMPPSSKLADDQIKVLTDWVEQGAPWPKHDENARAIVSTFDLQKRKSEHWCWQPAACFDPPNVKNSAWTLDPIDNFVLQKLEAAGLKPAEEAERRTWIRRVYFDLIGLPPLPDKVEKFADDHSDSAYENVVDELLSSLHFGERWARHWMDLVRYAESYGHEYDYAIAHAHEYRDYLIRAINADVPFDDFVREHVAGGLLTEPRRHPIENYNESILGTGFWFLGEATHGPVDVKADEAGRIDNQIDVLCKTFLGLTVACARCHDHKFDAISDEDYYAMSGFLQSSRRQTALLDPNRTIESVRETVNQHAEAADSVIKKWLDQLDESEDANEWKLDWDAVGCTEGLDDIEHPLHLLHEAFASEKANTDVDLDKLAARLITEREEFRAFIAKSEVYEEFQNGIPADWFTTGWAFDNTSPFEFRYSTFGNLIIAPDVATSGRNGGKFYGVLRSPTFELTHDQVLIRIKSNGNRSSIRLKIDSFEMDIHNPLLFVGCHLDLTPPEKFEWVKLSGDIKNYRGHKAWLEFIDHGDSFVEVDEIRFANEDCPAPANPPSRLAQIVIDHSPENREELKTAVLRGLGQIISNRSDFPGYELSELLALLANHSKTGEQLTEIREKILKETQSLPAPRMAVAMTDGSGEDEHLFIRGNSSTLGQVIPRQFLTALRNRTADRQPKFNGSGRLELANQIADKNNPLTSRVIVNRLWHHLLGQGIVASVDNFGLLGVKPTHPELLDYLACEFCDDGWSIKKMIRRIVLSQTYRMSSDINPQALALDPENKLLHRANVQRLEGEAIRDAVLQVSGSLDLEMYGKSIPVYLTEFMQGRGRPRAGGPLDGNGRRSIYVGVQRNFLSPMMLAFDTPIPFNTIGRRHQSNVPAQALIMMNDPFVLDQAGKWAKRLIKETKTPGLRIERMFYQAFSRQPTSKEVEMIFAFLQKRSVESEVEEQKFDDNEEVWRDVCHVVFNMKEFIFVK